MIGSSMITIVGEKSFFRLLFITALLTGLAGFASLSLFGSKSLIIGPQAFIYALLIVWLSFNPLAELFILFAIKFKAKTIVFVLIGIGILSLVSEGRYIDFLVVISGIITGYLYSTIIYSLKSPFNFLNKIDRAFISFGKLLRKVLRGGKQEVVHGKIIDIRSIKE
jgi:membrane associated rhomboid family serine protease